MAIYYQDMAEFARRRGSKDKKKRMLRNAVLAGLGVAGTVGAGYLGVKALRSRKAKGGTTKVAATKNMDTVASPVNAYKPPSPPTYNTSTNRVDVGGSYYMGKR